jgi:lipid-A-disaccharide synthase-like uncharacterized protein
LFKPSQIRLRLTSQILVKTVSFIKTGFNNIIMGIYNNRFIVQSQPALQKNRKVKCRAFWKISPWIFKK